MMIPFSRLLTTTAIALTLAVASGCGSNDTSDEATGHISRAETYSEQGQYRSALLEIRNAIQKDPGNVDHVVTLARTYLEIGAGEQAAEVLTPWLEDHRGQVTLPLAEAYLLQGKHLSAREILEGFEPAGDAEALTKTLLLAEADRLSGERQAAAGGFRNVLDQQPDHHQATIGLARTLVNGNQADRALTLLQEWRERNGDDPDILYLTALIQYQRGDLDTATANLTDATSVLPGSDIFLPIRRNILTLLSRSLTEQGRISEAQVYNRILSENTNSEAQDRARQAIEAIGRGDLETARTTLEDLIQQNPDNERLAMMLGSLNLQEGRNEEAESLLVDNVDAETTPTPFIRAATMAQIDSGKREEALATLDRAIKARPNDAELLGMHGILALSLPERTADGLASISKALELEPERSRLRLALAQHYLQQDKTEQALAQMRMAFTESPDDWRLSNTYLQMLLANDREEEAREIKESLLNGFADQPPALLLASITELRLGEAETALKRLQKLTDDNPDWAQAYLALASAYQQQDNTDKAVETLVTAATLNPELVTPLREATRLYAADHTPDETINWLRKLGSRHPEVQVNATIMAAHARIQQGRTDDARALLDALPEGSSSDAVTALTGQLLVAEARQAAQAGDWPTARAKAAEAATLQPDNLSFALVPASITAMEGKTDAALATLDDIEETHGPDATITLLRTRILRDARGNQAAWEQLSEAWENNPDDRLLPPLIALAQTESPGDMNRLTEAWVQRQPRSVAAHITRADYHMANGNEPTAMASYEEVLRLQPDNTVALNNLAWLLRERDRERALELASRASELSPENPAILDTHGWILHLADRNDEAVAVLERAAELAPGNDEILQHLDQVKQAL